MSPFPPIADISEMPDAWSVGCFRVLIQGEFTARVTLAPEMAGHGFYTTRWVVASDEEAAVRKAFNSARAELNRWTDLRDGLVEVEMEAQEVSAGSWWRWLKGGGRAFTFYADD